MLKLNNLTVTKTKKGFSKTILKNITISIPFNRVTLLIGKSGSGKTTILRCLANLEKSYKGEIYYNKNNIKNFKQKQQSQIFGFVSQAYPLFPHMNVLNNCANPLIVVLRLNKKKAYEEVFKTLALLDMEKYAYTYPQELSGGQQQRVAIARCLGLNPAFILLDEPTSALDPENSNNLINIINCLLKKNKGFIISSQDMSFVSKVKDYIFFLEHGKISESIDMKINKFDSTVKIKDFLCPIYSELN